MRIIAFALLLASIFLSPPASASADDGCQFILGFRALHDAIPDRVGDCLTNQSYDPASGNAIQRTTAWHGKGGLLVWRKADNWTAFTDGSTTWVNGPNGIERRGNSERFAWEGDYGPGLRLLASQTSRGFSLGSWHSGTHTIVNSTVTLGDTPPNLAEHSTVGRIGGSQTLLASTDSGQQTLLETTQTSLYGAVADARAAFAAWRPAGWEEIPAPTIGDESVALKRTLTAANGTEMAGYCVVFRRGAHVGSVVLVGPAGSTRLDDAVAAARRLDEKMR